MKKAGRPRSEEDPLVVELRLRVTEKMARDLDRKRGLVPRAGWLRELIRKEVQ